MVWSCSKAEKSDAGMEAPKQRGDRKETRREGRLEKDKKQRGEKGRKKKTLDHTIKQQTEVEKEKRR